jgi:hypothetical protein
MQSAEILCLAALAAAFAAPGGNPRFTAAIFLYIPLS